MARDFESLIVDPSLVDPSIDTSNLRTTTDTREELLAATPEFTGIQFDPTNINYLDDLYALYSGQLPMTPVTPAATTPAVGSPVGFPKLILSKSKSAKEAPPAAPEAKNPL